MQAAPSKLGMLGVLLLLSPAHLQQFCYNLAKRSLDVPLLSRNSTREKLDWDALLGSATGSVNGSAGRPMQCGTLKCYFPLPTKALGKMGYLVMVQRGEVQISSFLALSYANCIAVVYGARHLLVGPEERAVIPAKYEHRLQSLQTVNSFVPWARYYNRSIHHHLKYASRPEYTVVVQQVLEAPYPHFLIGCGSRKLWRTDQEMDRMRASVRYDKRSSFLQKLGKSLYGTRKLLVDEPCLAVDFQAIITLDGDIFHIDLDRCFHRKHRVKKSDFDSARAGIEPCFDQLLRRFATP